MKSVLIVGAGPAGLVAAKTLIHSSHPSRFAVTIVEQKERVGGMWAIRKGDRNGKCNSDMLTNLSRFTVSFSDLSWDSVSLNDSTNPLVNDSEVRNVKQTAPMFPRAWQVGRYLQAYAQMYIPENCIKLNSKVTKAERFQEDTIHKWKVSWNSTQDSSSTREGVFDYLIVGSGFFAVPNPLGIDVSSESAGKLDPTKFTHSSHFRHVTEFIPDLYEGSGNIVVIGGGMSGSEAGAYVASQLSSARYSPSAHESPVGYKCYHVTSRPFYTMKRYLPIDPQESSGKYNQTPTFLPMDLCLYDLSRRPPGPIAPGNGLMPPERAVKTHQYLESILGGDQKDLGSSALIHGGEQTKRPAYVGISDTYSNFVRSGDITPVRGRASGVGTSSDGKIVIHVEAGDEGQETKTASRATIENVVGIIYATGFTPQPAISFLPTDVLETLCHDSDSHRLPLLLQRFSFYNHKVLNLAFVGFYEGPFWGVMEMQARLIAKQWETGDVLKPVTSSFENAEKELDDLLSLREALREHHDQKPQFWMGDYVGLVETMSHLLDIPRSDIASPSSVRVRKQPQNDDNRTGPCVAARYTSSNPLSLESAKILRDLNTTLLQSKSECRFLPAATFSALQGPWQLSRRLTSFLTGFPSGDFKGTAHFHPRQPTDEKFDAEYLYIEQGSLTMETGMVLSATRRYAYRYNAVKDQISAWFVKDDGLTVDYLFNEMEFQPKLGEEKEGSIEDETGWIATSTHLCERDNYDSHCEFRFRGVELEKFAIDYEVKGPKKDYVSRTWYTR
ncbi:FAD/NAD(P)-binding domain-containing protein [Patellaria atrata CBS 101060]|uniref:FAD/NAD(P)-binding domain-containing protein n=1 Tax=Patellaria atrata CBS 101060 TaxID=1346257 RepID=A0A9P4SJK2_9PEZI|nr:FAD/NAD(P)-binding domain-containing protein [Patellaria atrata CBS 101060]